MPIARLANWRNITIGGGRKHGVYDVFPALGALPQKRLEERGLRYLSLLTSENRP